MSKATQPGLVIAITCVGIVLATAAWLLLRSQERNQLLRDHIASEQVVARTGAAGIDAILQGSASELDRLSRLPSVRYLRDEDRLQRTLESFLDRTPVRPAALVRVDTTGRVLFVYPETGADEALGALQDLGYFRQAGTSAARLLSTPVEGPEGAEVVALSDLIHPDGSAPLGAIVALIPAASLAGPVVLSAASGRAVLRVVDGTILHETRAADAAGFGGGPGEGGEAVEGTLVARAPVPAEIEPRLEVELWSTRAAALAPLRESARVRLFLLVVLNGLIAVGGGFLARELWLRRRLSETVEQRRELEMRLQQAERLKAVGRLTGGVAHDFNNILTAVVGHADFAADALGSDHPAREDVDEIRRAAERARSLVQQLLAFSRQQVLAPQVLLASDVVRSLEPMLRRVVRENLELIVSAPADLHAVEVDRTQLEQVVVNLVVNARDAMPDGGVVRIELENDVVTPAAAAARAFPFPPGAYVRLSVTDTGSGIDAETREHIFEPFFTTKAPGEGTGLGLATVYGIVKQSGGYIDVCSEPGRGTRFDIWLPRCEAAPEASLASTASTTSSDATPQSPKYSLIASSTPTDRANA